MPVRAALRRPLSLRHVLSDAVFCGGEDIWATACAADSRRVRHGTVFVVLSDTGHDEEASVSEAIARGCSGIVAERAVLGSIGLGVPTCRVPRAGEAFGRICQALAGDPSRQLKVLGISGAAGRTTLSCLLASILTTTGYKVGVLGALGCFDGRAVGHLPHITPPPPQLARWLARMVENGCTHAVMEVSRQALDEGRMGGIALDAACVGHVARVSGARQPRATDATCRVPPQLLEHLAPEGLAVLNADDPASRTGLQLHDGPVLTVGIDSQAEITATFLERSASEQTILLCAGNDAIPVRTRMIGRGHAYRCLQAAAVGLAYGIDLPTIVRGLEAIDYVPGRLERIECGQPFAVFVDRARTSGAIRACLKTLRQVTGGRLICVFGAGVGHGLRLGRAVERRADLVVIADANPRDDDPQAIIEDVLSGLKRPADAEVIPDRAEAIGWALSQARPGDCVLIAGTSNRGGPATDRACRHLDDRQVARQWLYANPPNEATTPSSLP